MQEKLIEILSRATAWMTAQQIADAGGWRSASNVTVALQQMEKANGQVERRKSPSETMGNGLPATEWKLTDKKINDATESKMGRKPKHPPLEKVSSEADELRKQIADLHAESAGFFSLIEDHPKRQQMEDALLWTLYHHQGGSSHIGQPIRKLLGIGQHDRLTDEQIAEAKAFGGAA